jgi:hypothetical protein
VSDGSGEAILTLEPLIEVVREGVEIGGWELSGLQKTTSHQFEGRWEGDSTRSAYLFFHNATAVDVSIDVYLDETSRGLTGNLALVVELMPLAELGGAASVIDTLAALGRDALPSGHRTPLTLRLRLGDQRAQAGSAEAEVRFKLQLPRATIAAGHAAVLSLTLETVEAFQVLLGRGELTQLMAVHGQ